MASLSSVPFAVSLDRVLQVTEEALGKAFGGERGDAVRFISSGPAPRIVRRLPCPSDPVARWSA